jgi:hypothetical protein
VAPIISASPPVRPSRYPRLVEWFRVAVSHPALPRELVGVDVWPWSQHPTVSTLLLSKLRGREGVVPLQSRRKVMTPFCPDIVVTQVECHKQCVLLQCCRKVATTVSPMLLASKSRVVRVLLSTRAAASAPAPKGPMSLSHKWSVVRVAFPPSLTPHGPHRHQWCCVPGWHT